MKLVLGIAAVLVLAWLGLWVTSTGVLVSSSDTGILKTRDCRYLVGVTVQKRSSSILALVTMTSPDGRYDRLFMSNYALLNIIDHTSVDEALRGTGASRRLVQAAVEWARAENVKLLPLCPFARYVFDKTPEYADVLAP